VSLFDPNDLTCDAFLGGRLKLLQPRHGYRAGIDAVLLSASIQATKGARVLELGCGVGAAILCLGARTPGLQLTGVEREEPFASLARRNGGDALEVVTSDITALPLTLRQRQFDHVLANPPYYDRRTSVTSADPAREAAHGADTPLSQWVKVAAKRLAPKGQAHFIHQMSALPVLLRALPADLGSVEVLPLAARQGRAPDRFILRARKNGRADFILHPALVLHIGDNHAEAGNAYVPQIKAVLREGGPLLF
jgi:tRNA1(Val) A37 N6-methylase TrmN6